MKKFLLFTVVITLFFSVKALCQTKPLTLNGIDGPLAKTMIGYFKDVRAKDITPLPTTVWFSKDVVIKVAALLEDEKSHQTGANITDGLRIYFISESDVPSIGGNYKLAVVSTKSNGTQITPGNDTVFIKHLDYYEHDPNNALFKIDPAVLQGDVKHDNSGGAALLYTHVTGSLLNEPTCVGNKMYHYRNRKAAQQMVENFGKNPINTYSVWFDLPLIKYLAKTIQNRPSHSGIRIYFARHSADDTNDSFADRDTFIVTTTDNATGPNIDYFYCDDPPGPLKDVKSGPYFYQIWKKVKVNGKIIKKKITVRSPPIDKGEMCPTNCN